MVCEIPQPGGFQNLDVPQGEAVTKTGGSLGISLAERGVGTKGEKSLFKRKDDTQQVGDDWITVGKPDAREGNKLLVRHSELDRQSWDLHGSSSSQAVSALRPHFQVFLVHPGQSRGSQEPRCTGRS